MRDTDTGTEPTLRLGFTERNSESAVHICTGERLPAGTWITSIQATRNYPADIELLHSCCRRTYNRSTW
jgi:hypothetical protein